MYPRRILATRSSKLNSQKYFPHLFEKGFGPEVQYQIIPE